MTNNGSLSIVVSISPEKPDDCKANKLHTSCSPAARLRPRFVPIEGTEVLQNDTILHWHTYCTYIVCTRRGGCTRRSSLMPPAHKQRAE